MNDVLNANMCGGMIVTSRKDAPSVVVKVKRLNPKAKLPTKAKEGDAGYDLYSCVTITLLPNSINYVPIGIATEFSSDYAALVWDRSGLGRKGVHRLAGVIDSGYRGEWSVVLANLTDQPYTVNSGDRVAQVLFQKVESVQLVDTEDTLSDSVRSDSGFGSSGL